MSDILDQTIHKGAFSEEAVRTLFPKLGPLFSITNTKIVGIGIWHGTVTAEDGTVAHAGEHVALFSDKELVSILGPKGDPATEAYAAFFMFVYNSYDHILKTIEK